MPHRLTTERLKAAKKGGRGSANATLDPSDFGYGVAPSYSYMPLQPASATHAHKVRNSSPTPLTQ